jgi:formiminotetrahydrofolate cyclodeaminase
MVYAYDEYIKNLKNINQLQQEYIRNLEQISHLYNEFIKNIERVNELYNKFIASYEKLAHYTNNNFRICKERTRNGSTTFQNHGNNSKMKHTV